MGNCLECNNPFEPKIQGGFVRKFCCDKHRARYNSRFYEKKFRNDIEFKKKKSEYFKKWYQRNKKRHKINMRFYMRGYYQAKYSKKAREKKEVK